ncbi:MAG: hypothetical protein HY519_04115 [Candidatus Aenigmarchaeota archaeon]|nr:hypothetical protein [Candidatus Aenigmarchaeota archaeon]
MKLKSMPSLRAKKRYVVFKLHTEDELSYANVRNAVYGSLEEWLGQKEMAVADVRLIQNLWNPKSHTGFIRCGHQHADAVSMGLALVHQIGDSKVAFQTVGVAGTIKSGKRKLEHARY